MPTLPQFNTTSSMGRLTLNVLLSFAQFEREVTGERIRDKIAASKKKGLWMGGNVPLGYDASERTLVRRAARIPRWRGSIIFGEWAFDRAAWPASSHYDDLLSSAEVAFI